MLVQRSSLEWNSDDRQVYKTWLRKTVVAYMALLLGLIVVVSWQATTSVTNVGVVLADTAAEASP